MDRVMMTVLKMDKADNQIESILCLLQLWMMMNSKEEVRAGKADEQWVDMEQNRVNEQTQSKS